MFIILSGTIHPDLFPCKHSTESVNYTTAIMSSPECVDSELTSAITCLHSPHDGIRQVALDALEQYDRKVDFNNSKIDISLIYRKST